MRMHSVTSTIENGFVYLPDEAEWLADYQRELVTFPKGKFDDQCDSTSQALDWLKTGLKFENFLRLFKHLAEKDKSAQDDKPIEGNPARSDKQAKLCPVCGSALASATGSEQCQKCGHHRERPVVFSF